MGLVGRLEDIKVGWGEVGWAGLGWGGLGWAGLTPMYEEFKILGGVRQVGVS